MLLVVVVVGGGGSGGGVLRVCVVCCHFGIFTTRGEATITILCNSIRGQASHVEYGERGGGAWVELEHVVAVLLFGGVRV